MHQIIHLSPGVDFKEIPTRRIERVITQHVHNGINLHSDPRNWGSGWITPPTFSNWGDENFEGHVGVESLGFGTEMTEVVVESQGYGYIPSVEIYVVDGRPQPSDANFLAVLVRLPNIHFWILIKCIGKC